MILYLHVCCWLTYLRAPLKRQATNSPGRPGRSLNTSITKYSTIYTKKLNIRMDFYIFKTLCSYVIDWPPVLGALCLPHTCITIYIRDDFGSMMAK